MKKAINFLILTGCISLVISCESGEKKHSTGAASLTDVKVVNELDPVCGMSTSEHLKDTLTYEGKLYGFCSTNCKEEFKESPKDFLKGR
ncbi:MAG: YHS domain-containing protein [Flavobacteriaceae bacterium]|jgi:YHS domain-containing protein|nr:YHS domain-containing protein [Flavobacteriaceae bacterium]